MAFYRGDIVSVEKDGKKVIGRILRTLSSRSCVEIQFWSDKIGRFLVRDFESHLLSHCTKEDKDYLKRVSQEHNLKCVGADKMACR